MYVLPLYIFVTIFANKYKIFMIHIVLYILKDLPEIAYKIEYDVVCG